MGVPVAVIGCGYLFVSMFHGRQVVAGCMRQKKPPGQIPAAIGQSAKWPGLPQQAGLSPPKKL